MEEIIKELGLKIDAFKETTVTKADVEALTKELNDIKAKGVDTDNLQEQINVLKEQMTFETKVKDTLKEVLESKRAEFQALKDNRSGSVQVVVKAVGNMTFANVTGEIPQGEREAGITRIQRRKPFILDLVQTGNINSNLWQWVQQTNAEGGAGMTAEGTKKSQADFNLELAEASVKKVTAFIKVTKEMLDDIDLLRSEIDQELTEVIKLKVDEQVLSGDGTGQNLTGILENATAWSAGAFALNVVNPNNGDVLRTAINQVMLSQFEPNYIVLHPSDATQMDLDKTDTGVYVLRPFTNTDGTVVSGVPVVTNTGVTQGDFLVGDFTKSAVRYKEGLTINVGYENDDFTKNFVTILAEARLVHRVKSNHYGAFVTGTFSTAITALTKA